MNCAWASSLPGARPEGLFLDGGQCGSNEVDANSECAKSDCDPDWITRTVAAYVRGGNWALPTVRALLGKIVQVRNPAPPDGHRRCVSCGAKFPMLDGRNTRCLKHRGSNDATPYSPEPEPASIVESARLILDERAMVHDVGGWIDRRRGEDDAAYWARLAALRAKVDSALYAEMFEEQAKIAASIRSDAWESFAAVECALLGIVPLWNALGAPIRRCPRCGRKYVVASKRGRPKLACKRCKVAERVERHREATAAKPRDAWSWYRNHTATCAVCADGAEMCAEYLERFDEQTKLKDKGHGRLSIRRGRLDAKGGDTEGHADTTDEQSTGAPYVQDSRAPTAGALVVLISKHGYRKDVAAVVLDEIRHRGRDRLTSEERRQMAISEEERAARKRWAAIQRITVTQFNRKTFSRRGTG
jgi:hypothetical protein